MFLMARKVGNHYIWQYRQKFPFKKVNGLKFYCMHANHSPAIQYMYVAIVWFILNNIFITHSSNYLRVPDSSQSITDIIGNVSGLVTNRLAPNMLV